MCYVYTVSTMKTILVDAWNTFVTENGVNSEMYELLETYPQKKIILTNANDEEIQTLGLVDLPYELFTLKHNPNKTDPTYYITMLARYDLRAEDVVYFEHNTEAVESARSVGITTHHYDHEKKDIQALKVFLDEQLQ